MCPKHVKMNRLNGSAREQSKALCVVPRCGYYGLRWGGVEVSIVTYIGVE